MADARLQLIRRYGIAVLAVAAALAFRLSLGTGYAPEPRFLYFLGAVLLSAWYGGLGPGLLATALSVLLSIRYPPLMIWPSWLAPGLGWPLKVFVFEGLMISLLGEHLHTALGGGRSDAPDAESRQRAGGAAADPRQRLATAESARREAEFMSTLCHDLRSPLNAILGWVQLRRGGAFDHATELRAWNAIERSARAQAEMIDKLLDQSRPADAPPDAAPLPSASDTSGLRVLIVDDDPEARELVRTVLDRGGAEVKCCASAPEALNVLQQWQPDAMVSDLDMPGEDGYALIARIRALEPQRGGQVPAIALSGFTRAEDQRHALSAGFQVCLAKPVESDSLLAAVAALARHAGAAAGGGPGARSLWSC